MRTKLVMERPMIAPPRNAMRRAFPDDVRTAFAVLTFALTVAFMPMTVASKEQNAPTTNPTAICHPRKTKRGTSRMTTKHKIVLISRFRKVFAPSWMQPAISRM